MKRAGHFLLVPFLLLPINLLAINSRVMGQIGSEGAILGVVKDSHGAVITGAEITIKHLETGLKKTSVTNNDGNFEIPALPIGVYSVSVAAQGFKTWVLERLELTVQQRQRVTPTLEVGQMQEQLTITATEALVQTEKVTVQGIIEQKQIRDLPLNGRNPVQLVNLVPGMRYLAFNYNSTELGHYVQGGGNRADNTEFQVDGLNANAGVDETGIGIPNVDAISEFSVETSNFSAEYGRNPLEVNIATKSGSNDFHGTLWEFYRNQAFDARNADALTKPKLLRNQFGFTLGGPILKDRTHFFSSYEGTRIREERIYDSTVVTPAMLKGDFSALTKTIKDPQTGKPFPGNIIPDQRISNASKFFFPYILLPNSPDGRFKGLTPIPNDTDQFVLRIDHQLTSKQRVYGRWIPTFNKSEQSIYKPGIFGHVNIKQHTAGVNYVYAITPNMVFTGGVSYLRVFFTRNTPDLVGKENLTEEAGINGFPTAGREGAVGLPTVTFSGYTGFTPPAGDPYLIGSNGGGATASLNIISGAHSVSFGYRFDTRSGIGRHTSCCARGNFRFTGQYTGDGFADYLLGLVQRSIRNYPLASFGMSDSPYSGLYVQDYWKVNPNITLNLGLRYDYWHAKAFVRGNGSTFDPRIGKAIAAEVKPGVVDLTAQPVAPFYAKATQGLWVPASEVNIPPGLFKPSGNWAPRLGITWRPTGSTDLVVRAGYGIFYSSFIGNITASGIVGPPYWALEQKFFTRSAPTPWETAWPNDPETFDSPSIEAAAWDIKTQKNHEWNLSIQKSLPFKTALTVSYVGNRGLDLVTGNYVNEVPPGEYEDLQAARPFPKFSTIYLYQNLGNSWYHAMQVKLERRFSDGLSYGLSYAFSKMTGFAAGNTVDSPPPFAPKGYDQGRTSLDRTHILVINGIYDLPFGRGKKYLNSLHPVLQAIFGGWEFSGIYNFTSGTPLTFNSASADPGNGFGARADLVGNPRLPHPNASLWFDPSAFATPPDFTYGNSGPNILDGPGHHSLDTAMMKNFHLSETKYLQLRWEMFNATNHVNLSNPVTTIGLPTTGMIFGADDARQMQFAVKFVF
jgi:outer membrane receptor protein involved in Fe transport